MMPHNARICHVHLKDALRAPLEAGACCHGQEVSHRSPQGASTRVLLCVILCKHGPTAVVTQRLEQHRAARGCRRAAVQVIGRAPYSAAVPAVCTRRVSLPVRLPHGRMSCMRLHLPAHSSVSWTCYRKVPPLTLPCPTQLCRDLEVRREVLQWYDDTRTADEGRFPELYRLQVGLSHPQPRVQRAHQPQDEVLC